MSLIQLVVQRILSSRTRSSLDTRRCMQHPRPTKSKCQQHRERMEQNMSRMACGWQPGNELSNTTWPIARWMKMAATRCMYHKEVTIICMNIKRPHLKSLIMRDHCLPLAYPEIVLHTSTICALPTILPAGDTLNKNKRRGQASAGTTRRSETRPRADLKMSLPCQSIRLDRDHCHKWTAG